MTDLTDAKLTDILPSSITGDDQIQAIADALDWQIQSIAEDANNTLPWLSNLVNLPERIIDLLAWQYHCDIYDPNAPIVDKIDRLQRAILDHQIYGTRAAVAKQCDELLGADNYEIKEWWEESPKGDPYTYKIICHVPKPPETLNELRERVKIVANVRSLWITGLKWNELDAAGDTWNDLDALLADWDHFDNYLYYFAI